MTERERTRRLYLETANAIYFYLASPVASAGIEKLIELELVRSAKAFQAAAETMKETQESGLP